MSIISLLLGKKKTINHPKLGIIKSDRIRGNNLTKTYTWRGGIIIGNNTIKTQFYLKGKSSSPLSNQIDFVCQLVENWDKQFLPKIEEEIVQEKINTIKAFSNWRNDFYLAAIYARNDKSSDFELTLEPKNENITDTMGIEVKNGLITKVSVY
ncbi:hypothetical protein [Maribacter sp.]|uniref:hypothetical protein n=1 Tax=Maribacter sp. TaxID=1897614 RepID=UPI0025BFF442|nr:hypothetical protein [Maribacter sp.]